MEFDWDDANAEHIAVHGVEPFEAEEAVGDARRVVFPSHDGPYGAPRRGFIGKTDDGRILIVILEKRSDRLRVVTARDATAKEKGWYRR